MQDLTCNNSLKQSPLSTWALTLLGTVLDSSIDTLLKFMKRRILMIEDNHIHRLLTQDFFTHQGYEIKGLEDGNHFLSTLATFEPHLIMLDLKLPGVDGFSLLEQLRQSCWYEIPVIVVSAYTFEPEKQRARKLDVCHYFTKPTNLEALERCVALELSSSTNLPTDSQVD